MQGDHGGKDDWQFTFIDKCTTNVELRKKRASLATSPSNLHSK